MNKTLGIPNLDVANFTRRSDEWRGTDSHHKPVPERAFSSAIRRQSSPPKERTEAVGRLS